MLQQWRGFFFSSRRRHTRWTGDWSSDVCSSDLLRVELSEEAAEVGQTAGHVRNGRAGPGALAAFQVGDHRAAQRLGHPCKVRLPGPLWRGVLAGRLDLGAQVVEHRMGGVERAAVVL